MTREEAREFLIDISYKIEGIGMECLGDEESEKMREAIEVLEQTHCIAEVKVEFDEERLKELVDEAVEEAGLRWIPVSERLPEDGQSVLFCDIEGDIMVGYHIKGRPYTHFSQDGTFDDIKNVCAWMPLPEPYKAESEEIRNDSERSDR